MTANNTALLVMDLQNDLVHPDGVLPKHSKVPIGVEGVINNVAKLMGKRTFPTIACQLTILTHMGRGIGLKHFATRFPFLVEGGCREGSWGHALVDALPKPEFTVQKWTYSAFYQTTLDHVLDALRVKRVILTGYSTNGVVEWTARDAFMRGLEIVTLTDCVTSSDAEAHQRALTVLGQLGALTTSDHV